VGAVMPKPVSIVSVHGIGTQGPGFDAKMRCVSCDSNSQ